MEGVYMDILEFGKIAFPVDLSEVSKKIVPLVITMARKFEAEVHLLFVARTMSYFTTDMYVDPEVINRLESEVVEGARRKIEDLLKEFSRENIPSRTWISVGDPAEEIIEYVKKERVDLIIMATHGRKGLDRILFGSVAERVIKMSPVPVMSINPYSKPSD
jgi:nucleotide-binding universal stress UspA family protein